MSEFKYKVVDGSNVSWYAKVTPEIDKYTVDVIADYFRAVIEASDTAEQVAIGFSGYMDGLQAALHAEEEDA